MAEIGQVAGCKNPDGYILTQIKGVKYFNHILANLYMTGNWPTGQIDHINNIRDDNRWNNLQDISKQDNQAKRKWKAGVSGTCGIQTHSSGKWQVVYKRKYRGVFKSLEEAKEFLGGLENSL